MSDQIKINRAMVEHAIEEFLTNSRLYDDISKEVSVIANNLLNDGILTGEAGDSLSEGLRNDLSQNLYFLKDKYEELAGDLVFAQDELVDADNESWSLYQ